MLNGKLMNAILLFLTLVWEYRTIDEVCNVHTKSEQDALNSEGLSPFSYGLSTTGCGATAFRDLLADNVR